MPEYLFKLIHKQPLPDGETESVLGVGYRKVPFRASDTDDRPHAMVTIPDGDNLIQKFGPDFFEWDGGAPGAGNSGEKSPDMLAMASALNFLECRVSALEAKGKKGKKSEVTEETTTEEKPPTSEETVSPSEEQPALTEGEYTQPPAPDVQ